MSTKCTHVAKKGKTLCLVAPSIVLKEAVGQPAKGRAAQLAETARKLAAAASPQNVEGRTAEALAIALASAEAQLLEAQGGKPAKKPAAKKSTAKKKSGKKKG